MNARIKPIHNPSSRAFGGAKKAAALLFSLDKYYAQRLLQHLSPDERKKIAQAARQLQAVEVKDVEQLIDEFTRIFAESASFDGAPDDIQALFSGYLDEEEIKTILGRENRTPVWSELNRIDNTAIVKYLKDEHPQTIAFLLSQFESEIASEIAGALPAPLRNNALRRMLVIGDVHPKVMHSIEDALRTDLMPTEFSEQSGKDPIAHMGDILNGLQKDAVEEAIQELQTDYPEETVAIRKRLFAFEDIGILLLQARAAVFDQVPTEQVILALKNCSETIVNDVLEALPARSRRMVENELSLSVAAKEADIESARKMIQTTVLRLAGSGEIQMPTDDEDGEAPVSDQNVA